MATKAQLEVPAGMQRLRRRFEFWRSKMTSAWPKRIVGGQMKRIISNAGKTGV